MKKHRIDFDPDLTMFANALCPIIEEEEEEEAKGIKMKCGRCGSIQVKNRKCLVCGETKNIVADSFGDTGDEDEDFNFFSFDDDDDEDSF